MEESKQLKYYEKRDLNNLEIDEYKKEIRLIKRRINIFLALISILEEKNIEEIGIISSKFADLLIKSSLQFSIFQYYKDNSKLFYKEIDIANSGFFLIALGKLGSYDLNYSSDIDLLFFFDDEKVKQYLNKSPGYHLNLMLKKFINILSDTSLLIYIPFTLLLFSSFPFLFKSYILSFIYSILNLSLILYYNIPFKIIIYYYLLLFIIININNNNYYYYH